MPLTKTQTRKIYVVDDDDSVRRALGRLLRSEGLNSETFASGETFLASLPADAQGCVVMDIRMPDLTGHDVQEKLRGAGQMIPVIALSAQDNEDARRRAHELGAVAFFRKPVEDQALLDAIQWAMRE
jgi:FixJ family two-component response regulator